MPKETYRGYTLTFNPARPALFWRAERLGVRLYASTRATLLQLIDAQADEGAPRTSDPPPVS